MIKRPSALIKRPLASSARSSCFLAPGGSLLSWLVWDHMEFAIRGLNLAAIWLTALSHLWLRFPFVSSRNLKFVHGPAVDKFFTREMVKCAIRAPNPEIWPRLPYLVFETSI